MFYKVKLYVHLDSINIVYQRYWEFQVSSIWIASCELISLFPKRALSSKSSAITIVNNNRLLVQSLIISWLLDCLLVWMVFIGDLYKRLRKRIYHHSDIDCWMSQNHSHIERDLFLSNMRTQCSSYVIDTKKTDTSQMEKRLPGQDIFLLRNSRMLTLTGPQMHQSDRSCREFGASDSLWSVVISWSLRIQRIQFEHHQTL